MRISRHRDAVAADVETALRALRGVGDALRSPMIAPDPPPRATRRRWLARSARPLLWILAVLLFFGGVPAVTESYQVAMGWAVALAALFALPLGVMYTAPLRAWRLSLVGALIAPLLLVPEPWQTMPWPASQAFVGAAVCFAVAVRHHWRVVLAVWVMTILAMAWGLWWLPTTGVTEQLAGATTVSGLILLMGYLIGTRGELARRLDEGERLRMESETQRAILEERTRIARELHDVVAHHMSMISVQAETAPFRMPDLGEQGRASMADIAATAREALAEMRRLLGVLRDDTHDTDRAPQPGLDQLDQLAAGARRAGLAVELTVTGDPRPLPPGTELSAYRIVQESLSNAAWHAPNARVRVELDHGPALLRVRVTNDPPPRPVTPSRGGRGHGLLGMRERAALHGGTVHVGPTPEGGYRVDATLPLDGEGPRA